MLGVVLAGYSTGCSMCTSVLEEHVVIIRRHLIILVTVGVEGAVVVDLCYYKLLKDWARPAVCNAGPLVS